MTVDIARNDLNNPYALEGRNFRHDIPSKIPRLDDGADWTLHRVANIALPFICLHGEMNQIVSTCMNVTRPVTSLYHCYTAEEVPAKLFEGAMAAAMIGASFFHSRAALLVTVATDIFYSLKSCKQHLSDQEYALLCKEVFSIISNLLYVHTITSGALGMVEIAVAQLLLRGLSLLIESRDEWKKDGHTIDAFAKLALGVIKLSGARGLYVEERERRELVATMFAKLVEEAEIVPTFAEDHPMHRLQDAVEAREVIYKDPKSKKQYNLGAHFHSMGGSLVKGMNVIVSDDGEGLTLDFKVNHVFRERMKNIELLERVFVDNGSGAKVLSYGGRHYSLSEIGEGVPSTPSSDFIQIFMTNNKKRLNSYDRVQVRVPKGSSVTDLHRALALIGYEQALQMSTEDEMERMKIGHLFHSLCPEQAFKLERTRAFFDLPIEALKGKMAKMDPKMKGYFKELLPNMKLEEIFPGRRRFQMHGLYGKIEQQVGPFHFSRSMSGIKTTKEACARVHRLMSVGLYSVEMEQIAGFEHIGRVHTKRGDFRAANDSVFTQAVTAQESYYELQYPNPWRIIIDGKSMEMGTFQYHRHWAGSRVSRRKFYQKRPGAIEYVEGEYERGPRWVRQETMSKDFIAPRHITGVIAPSEQARWQMIHYLVKHCKFSRDRAKAFVRLEQAVDHASATGVSNDN
ncbi:hypothetical protein K0U07_01680 [bacterium]|nr:hypothetical protein [bacterium]